MLKWIAVIIPLWLPLHPAWAVEADSIACYRDAMSSAPDDRPKSERKCLERLSGIAERSGNDLSIVLANGKRKKYRNAPTACEDGDTAKCIEHRVAEYIKAADTIVIDVGSYEGQAYDVIDRKQGSTATVDERPYFSPSHKLFVVASGSETSSYTGVQIWERQNGKLIKKWNYETKDYELYEFVKWIDEDRVALKVTKRAANGLKTTPIRLERVQGTWKLSK